MTGTEYISYFDSPVGRLLICANEYGINGIWFDESSFKNKFGEDKLKSMISSDTQTHISAAKNWLSEYFAGKRPDTGSVKLALYGSGFQKAVWRLLLEIPYGSTVSYKDISERLKAEGRKVSPRCVGGAVGKNPASIIVPCHRVIGSDKSLTGFGGGIDRKIFLLKHEGAGF